MRENVINGGVFEQQTNKRVAELVGRRNFALSLFRLSACQTHTNEKVGSSLSSSPLSLKFIARAFLWVWRRRERRRKKYLLLPPPPLINKRRRRRQAQTYTHYARWIMVMHAHRRHCVCNNFLVWYYFAETENDERKIGKASEIKEIWRLSYEAAGNNSFFASLKWMFIADGVYSLSILE